MKLYVYLALAAILAGAIYHDHLGWQRAKENKARAVAEAARADKAEVQAEAERKARVHEQTIAKQASETYANDLQRIRDESRAKPLRLPVRACLPGAGSAARAASGADASGAGRVEEDSAAPDRLAAVIGEYTEDCEANASQLGALQSWIQSR